MVKVGATFIADVRPQASVSVHVEFEARCVRKSCTTQVTLIRPFARVNTNMNPKSICPGRRVRTVRTGVQDHSPDLDGDTTNDDDF